MIPASPAQCTCWTLILSKPVLTLIAVGNRSMGDDGIGPVLLDYVRLHLADTIALQFWENKDALSIAAELLEINTAIVIIDCADMGLKGGNFKWLKQSECLLNEHFELLSSHDFGFAEALALVQQLGFNQDLYFFLVQPVNICYTPEICSNLKNKLPALANELLKQLRQFEN